MKKTNIPGPLYPRKVMCRFTVEEYEQLKTDSAALGLYMSDYFRRLIFEKRAHLLVDAAELVEWLDNIAIESSSSNQALWDYLKALPRSFDDRSRSDELGRLIVNYSYSLQNIERCIKHLIRLMAK